MHQMCHLVVNYKMTYMSSRRIFHSLHHKYFFFFVQSFIANKIQYDLHPQQIPFQAFCIVTQMDRQVHVLAIVIGIIGQILLLSIKNNKIEQRLLAIKTIKIQWLIFIFIFKFSLFQATDLMSFLISIISDLQLPPPPCCQIK